VKPPKYELAKSGLTSPIETCQDGFGIPTDLKERRIPVELTTKQKVEILYFDESKTVREIAETLGITTQAVYLHLKDLRERREERVS
jgi:hypothetical protein